MPRMWQRFPARRTSRNPARPGRSAALEARALVLPSGSSGVLDCSRLGYACASFHSLGYATGASERPARGTILQLDRRRPLPGAPGRSVEISSARGSRLVGARRRRAGGNPYGTGWPRLVLPLGILARWFPCRFGASCHRRAEENLQGEHLRRACTDWSLAPVLAAGRLRCGFSKCAAANRSRGSGHA